MKDPLLCATPGCYKFRPYQQGGYLKYCWTCRARQRAKYDPFGISYNFIKQSAKKRGIPFSITREEWDWWCKQTGYLEKRGRGKGKKSVGRIDHSRGYSLSNIRMEDWHANAIKGHEVPESEDVFDNGDPF